MGCQHRDHVATALCPVHVNLLGVHKRYIASKFVDVCKMGQNDVGAFHRDEEVEVVVREWVRMYGPDLYREGNFKILPKWDRSC